MSGPKEWVPSTTQQVWVVLWQGDWSEATEVYASEEAAVMAMVAFIKDNLDQIRDAEARSVVADDVRDGRWQRAIDIFTDQVSGWGRYMTLERQIVRTKPRGAGPKRST